MGEGRPHFLERGDPEVERVAANLRSEVFYYYCYYYYLFLKRFFMFFLLYFF